MKKKHLRKIRKTDAIEGIGDVIVEDVPRPIIRWIKQHISEPIRGFDGKRNFDGTYYSLKQQIKASREQLLLIAIDYYDRGYPPERIIQELQYFRKASY